MQCVVFDSRGGTTKGIANKVAENLGLESINCKDILNGNKPFEECEGFIFFTYTDKIGGISKRTGKFLEEHGDKMLGVVANGSSDFKPMGAFAVAGDVISEKYNVEIIRKLDRGGTQLDEHSISTRAAKLLGYKKEKVAFKPDITRKVNGLFQLERM